MANEKRLIDANALMDDVEMDGALYACLGAVDDVRFLVDSQPTVDAVEVVHGRWIDKKIDNFRMWELRCSECDWVGISNYDAYNEPYDFNYCPNCGAKMDGDGNG